MHMNRATIFGDLSDEPKLVETKNGWAFLKLNICTEKPVKKKDGSEVTIRAWHRATLWGADRARQLAETLKVGDPIYLEGEIQYGSYEKDGTKVNTTDINVGYDGKCLVFPSGASEVVDQAEVAPF